MYLGQKKRAVQLFWKGFALDFDTKEGIRSEQINLRQIGRVGVFVLFILLAFYLMISIFTMESLILAQDERQLQA